jgi:hypothetical protein
MCSLVTARISAFGALSLLAACASPVAPPDVALFDGAADTSVTDGGVGRDALAPFDAAGCAPEQRRCAGRCVDPSSSIDHCGSCGNACAGVANAVPVCAAGRCATVCEPGFADCDGEEANGCEVDTRSSAEHCGRCGRPCAAPSGMTAACAMGRCMACPEGLRACGARCADTATDPAHCGACGVSCGGLRCVSGACQTPPTLLSAEPSLVFGARVDQQVVLRGMNFRPPVTVRVDGRPARVLMASPTQVTIGLPGLGLEARSVSVEVFNDAVLGARAEGILSVRGVTTAFGAPTTFSIPTINGFRSPVFHVAVSSALISGGPRVVAALPDSAAVALLTPDSTGNLTMSATLPTMGTLPMVPVIADFDGDSRKDIAVAGRNQAQLAILRQTDAGFVLSTRSVPNPAAGLAAADLNANGTQDLVVGSNSSSALTVLVGLGDGTFVTQPPVATPAPMSSLTVGKLGGDDRLAVLSAVPNGLLVVRALDSARPDLALIALDNAAASPLFVGDLDNQRNEDVVVGSAPRGGALVALGSETSARGPLLTPTLLAPSLAGAATGIAVADLNGDTMNDLIVAGPGSRLAVYPNEGGRFEREVLLGAPGTPASVALLGVDGDGRLDLVVPQGTASSILVFRNQSLGVR